MYQDRGQKCKKKLLLLTILTVVGRGDVLNTYNRVIFKQQRRERQMSQVAYEG
jgi:hypothetical protein